MNNYIERYNAARDFWLANARATGCSEMTLKNYERTTRLFRDWWMEQNGGEPNGDPCARDMFLWRDHLTNSGMKPSSMKNYFLILRVFFCAVSDPELGEMQFYQGCPIPRKIAPRTIKEDRRPYDMILEDADVVKLVRSAFKTRSGCGLRERDYAVIALLLTSCLRNSEVLALTPDDLDWKNSEIIVERGKGNKYRTVPFHPLAQAAIKWYFASHSRPENEDSTSPLFGTVGESRGFKSEKNASEWKAMTSQGLSSMVERYVRAATGVDHVRTHDLRHVGARLKLNSGVGVEELQQELGHNSVVTTQLYSGRLMSRRKRQETEEVIAAMEDMTEQINAVLPNSVPYPQTEVGVAV